MPNKTLIDGMDGLKALLGQQLGASEWKQLAYEDIVRFAEATGDFQWIHVDLERCQRESPFGVPIAHGYFSVSRIAGLFFEVVDIRGFALVLNYGLNKVRFPAPLKLGARYRLSLKLAELKDIPKGVEASMLASIEIEGESKPACAAEVLYRYMLG
jgi:acyl dehydratase